MYIYNLHYKLRIAHLQTYTNDCMFSNFLGTFVQGIFNQIPQERYQKLVTIASGATDIVVQNNKPRNARIGK